jgi:sugar lactone lactonase YvrE
MRISRFPIASLTLAALIPALPIQAQVIHSVAGGGPPDNAVATTVSIGPLSLAVDSHGNVYFPSGEAVYKLDPTGHLTRVAGQSVAGDFLLGTTGNACPTAASIGDGGPATGATLNTPLAVALDANGNVYIADSFSCRIRVVNTQASSITVQGVTVAAGNIGTVAGSATYGSNGDSGPATSAQLYQPSGVALDSFGNLYIADTGNSRIRKVDTSGTITTFAGNGTGGCIGDGGLATSAEVNSPVGLATDGAGNLYIADDFGCNVRVVSTQASSTTILGVTVASKTIASVAGNGTPGYGGDNGPATSAQINNPRSVALDSFGNLYIADLGNFRIREVSTSGTITTFAGNGTAGSSGDGGPATSAEISSPYGVALNSSGDLYIADLSSSFNTPDYRIRVVHDGTINSVAGNGYAAYSGDGQIATGAEFTDPADVAVDAAGNLYIVDSFNNLIRAVNMQPNTITLLGITIPSGSIATVAGNINLHNCSTTTTECFGGDGGPATSAELNLPNGVALDSSGNLYIADSGNYRVRKVDASGTITTVVGSELIGDKNGPATGAALNNPLAVTLDWEGNIYVSDNYGNVVRAVNTQSYPINVQGVTIAPGDIATVAGNGTAGSIGDGGAAISAELSGPIGIAVDEAGNLYIADIFNSRVRKVDASGTITTVAGNGSVGYSGDNGPATSAELIGPYGVTADASGNLYIADAPTVAESSNSASRVVNNQVCAIDVLGVTIAPGDIATVAGNGVAGFSGDGGSATGAMLDYPTGSALDAAGNLYIADQLNLRIREVNAPPATAPDFSITVASPSVQVSQAGDSGTFVFTINSLNGFSGPIALSVLGDSAMGVSLPASVTLPSGGSQSFNVVLTSAPSPASGDFFFNIIGTTECGVVHSQRIDLVVGGSSTATTPTVTVTPSPASITTAQALTVTVAVGGTPTPTGSVTLTSGTYSSGAVTLSSGSATINIPAGSLATGTDTLTATYTPDSSSSATYTSATGSNTETVTAAATAPVVTVTPSPSSITTAQPFSVTVTVSGTPTPTGSVTLTSGSYSSGAVTLSSGSATINIPAGTLAKGADTLTATYTPDTASSSTYTSATGTNTETVTAAAVAPTVTITPSPSTITTVQGLTVAVNVSGTPTPTGSITLTSGTYSSGAVTLSSGSATINIPAGSLATGTDTLTVIYTPDSSSASTYTSATGNNSVTVTTPAKIMPTVTVTPSPASITTAQMLSVTVAVSGGSGNPTPTGSVTLNSGTYSSGLTTLISGNAIINIPAGSLATGTDTLTVIYTPDSNSSTTYNSATGSNSVSVTAATVQVTVTTNPAGLTFTVDGTSYSATQNLTWTVGANHTIATLTPQVLAGAQESFSSWSDGGAQSHSVTASSSTTAYTASFTATAYQLTTGASPSADGTVTPASGTFYSPGTVVNLTATANTGFSFSNWTGNVASTNAASTTVTMSAPQSVTANFANTIVTAPVASFSSLSMLTFTVNVGTTSAAQSATLTNSGNSALTITGISITGTNPTDFAISTGANACGATLAPGSSCSIYVTFAPTSTATFSATLSVADNAANSPQTVSLVGSGTPAPSFTIISSTSAQTVQPGGAVQYTITASAQNGTFPGSVSLAASGLPTGATATFMPTSITPGNSSANSTLSIQTGSAIAAAAAHGSSWPFATSALAVIGLCLVPGRRRRRWITPALLLIASLSAFTALTACGGGFGYATPPHSYTITVTGTSGTDVQTTTVQLTVQ